MEIKNRGRIEAAQAFPMNWITATATRRVLGAMHTENPHLRGDLLVYLLGKQLGVVGGRKLLGLRVHVCVCGCVRLCVCVCVGCVCGGVGEERCVAVGGEGGRRGL